MKLKDLDISSLNAIKLYIYNTKTISSFYTIGGLYFFSNLYKTKYIFFHNVLIIALKKDNELFYLPPLTKEKTSIYNCHYVPSDMNYSLTHIEPYEDEYIYFIDELLGLKGKKYQKIRNHINQFKKETSNIKLLPISQENIKDCEEIIKRRLSNKYIEDDIYVQSILNTILSFPVYGLIMYDNDIPLGFTVFEIKNDVCHIHIEKIIKDKKGVGDYFRINVLRKIKELYPFIKYINRQESMNINGLIRQKESLRPAFYLRHYQVKGTI